MIGHSHGSIVLKEQSELCSYQVEKSICRKKLDLGISVEVLEATARQRQRKEWRTDLIDLG